MIISKVFINDKVYFIDKEYISKISTFFNIYFRIGKGKIYIINEYSKSPIEDYIIQMSIKFIYGNEIDINVYSIDYLIKMYITLDFLMCDELKKNIFNLIRRSLHIIFKDKFIEREVSKIIMDNDVLINNLIMIKTNCSHKNIPIINPNHNTSMSRLFRCLLIKHPSFILEDFARINGKEMIINELHLLKKDIVEMMKNNFTMYIGIFNNEYITYILKEYEKTKKYKNLIINILK